MPFITLPQRSVAPFGWSKHLHFVPQHAWPPLSAKQGHWGRIHTYKNMTLKLPSRERSHIPPGEKENHLQTCLIRGDMLVPWRVSVYCWMVKNISVIFYGANVWGMIQYEYNVIYQLLKMDGLTPTFSQVESGEQKLLTSFCTSTIRWEVEIN